MLQPWNTEHAAGRISRSRRANGLPYQGINVVMLWSEAVARGFAAPIWMTFKQAAEFGAHVRKGEHGGLVVYASSSVKRTETDEATGKESERDVPFLKGYSVCNVEQIDAALTDCACDLCCSVVLKRWNRNGNRSTLVFAPKTISAVSCAAPRPISRYRATA